MGDTTKSKKIFHIILHIVYGLFGAFCIYLIIGSIYFKIKDEKFFVFNKYSFEIVVTQSMEPTIKTGSLVIVEKCNIKDIKIGEDGDVVCFKARNGAIKGNNVLHRAVGAYENINGEYCLYTKGDNNLNNDQDAGNLGEVNFKNFYGKAVFTSIVLGNILGYLKNPVNLIFITAVVLLIYFIIKSIFKLVKISKDGNKSN